MHLVTCRYYFVPFCHFVEEWASTGVIKLRLAFSRDQRQKVYVQHLIQQDAQLLWDLIGSVSGWGAPSLIDRQPCASLTDRSHIAHLRCHSHSVKVSPLTNVTSHMFNSCHNLHNIHSTHKHTTYTHTAHMQHAD